MRIMTTNIWGDYFGNPVAPRMEGIYSVYKNYSPDVIGFQEITVSWNESGLFEKLAAEYNFVGTHILDTVSFVPLAVKKKYMLLANGFEYFADTADKTKAVTWAIVKDDCNGKAFGVCNAHFWWMARNEEDFRIREKNAAQTATLMQYLSKRFDCPVFAFGDMNCGRDSAVFKTIYPSLSIKHLYDCTQNRDNISSHHGDPIIGDGGVCVGKKTVDDHTHSLDHIIAYGKDFNVLQYRVVEDKYVLDASDHSPVYADIELL